MKKRWFCQVEYLIIFINRNMIFINKIADKLLPLLSPVYPIYMRKKFIYFNYTYFNLE